MSARASAGLVDGGHRMAGIFKLAADQRRHLRFIVYDQYSRHALRHVLWQFDSGHQAGTVGQVLDLERAAHLLDQSSADKQA